METMQCKDRYKWGWNSFWGRMEMGINTDCLHELLPGPFLLSYSVFVFIFSFLGHALD